MGKNIKKWKVSCQCDMMAERHLSIIVEANTARKAIMFAKEKWKKEGHFCIWIESVEQI